MVFRSQTSGIHLKGNLHRTLDRMVEYRRAGEFVEADNLALGDQVQVTTRNSVYCLDVLGRGLFMVRGGWFELNESSPSRQKINGCTLGGTVLFCNIVAAPGLFLEFGNGVRTTRISRVQVRRHRTGEITH